MDLLIWWLSQEDCELIEASPLYQEDFNLSGDVDRRWVDGLPEYINVEFWSRIGRAGRNRLWVHSSLELRGDFAIEWNAESNAARKLAWNSYGGIVIRAEDKAAVIALPGILTDTNLRLIGD